MKNALHSNTIKQNFDLIFIKNDKIQVTNKCAVSNCSWHVHASKEGNIDTFQVKIIQATHNYGGGIGKIAHPKASKKWVCDCVIQKLKERPLYRVVDILKDILREYSVRLPYKRAWMGKEVVRIAIHVSEISSYDFLLWYADKVAEMNLDSVIAIENDNERFKCAFFFFWGLFVGVQEVLWAVTFSWVNSLAGKVWWGFVVSNRQR